MDTVTINEAVPENQAPIAYDDALSVTATENGSWTFTANDLLGNDFDPDDDVLALTNFVSPAGTVTDNGDQTYTFTPNDPASVAAVDIIYALSDGEGGEDTATATFSVAPYVAPNQPPTDITLDAMSVGENAEEGPYCQPVWYGPERG